MDKEIRLENFRGITHALDLSFTKNKKACSCLLYGDNGSGKSSIIDGIELSTHGSIKHSSSGKWINNSISLYNSNDSYDVL